MPRIDDKHVVIDELEKLYEERGTFYTYSENLLMMDMINCNSHLIESGHSLSFLTASFALAFYLPSSLKVVKKVSLHCPRRVMSRAERLFVNFSIDLGPP